jgi:nitroreductase
MDAIELLITRTSNGKLTEPEPDLETLRLAYLAASRAPDHKALRPYRVFDVPTVCSKCAATHAFDSAS